MNYLDFLLTAEEGGDNSNNDQTNSDTTNQDNTNTDGGTNNENDNHEHNYVEGKCECGAVEEQQAPNIMDMLSTMGMPIILILAMVAMWWFSSRSQKKRDKEAQDMRDSLQVGDEVTTIGGIIGKVVSVKDETFVLETTKERTHIRFLKAAIRSVDVRVADVAAAAAEPKKEETPAEEQPKKKFSLFGKSKKQ